jgi:hypothetical protein
MAGRGSSLTVCQICACVLGMLAALTPGVSFSDLFTGMDYMSINGFVFFGQTDPRVQVTMVKAGSPAERTGFRQGDGFPHPPTFEGVQAAGNAAQRGEKRVFRIKREETELTVQGVLPRRELVSTWYANAWDLVAGGLFIGIGSQLFATGPLVLAPWWRSFTKQRPRAKSSWCLSASWFLPWAWCHS